MMICIARGQEITAKQGSYLSICALDLNLLLLECVQEEMILHTSFFVNDS